MLHINKKDSLSWFLIGMLILAGSLCVNQRVRRASAMEQLDGQSNGFHGRNIVDEYAAPKSGSYLPSVSTPLTFNLNVPINQEYIKLVFRYRCVNDCPSVWLDIPSKEGQVPIRLLLRHRVLQNYRYPSVSGNGMTLFQKKVRYETVDAFLASPPSSGVTYTEESLSALFPRLARSVKYLEEAFEQVMPPDYILTSYLKPRTFPNDWYEFGRIIDVRGALRDANGGIQMGIFGGPGEVMIDVTQPEMVLMMK